MPDHVLAIVARPSLEAPAAPDASDWRFVDPASPQLTALDLGATRGDGIFETLSVNHGRAQALDHHLRRFARSAAMLDLPAPDLATWRAVILAAVAELDVPGEAFVKIVMTRGIEYGDRPTGWAYGSVSPDFTRERSDGVSVVLLDRGYRHDVERTSPWLLAGAKTLSYAVNRAVAREAARRGADDVVFVSSDGIVLEGPTSTVVYRRGDGLFSPGTGLGILDGTTQANVFRWAEGLGMSTAFELTTPDILRSADAAWLVSSVRLAAPVRAIDGVPLPVDREFTDTMNGWLAALDN
ncbi:4-amino-4-deoxychorismate lyase [Microbacteriaceae bacterium SG_E_30_P1]|uniref:4-amino-4-deoxychorismate lyase n=1 Tax=Antiquaquibacter oligotrophicus TaxID=2880260 RepID=A0ABT6KJK0_9MICO|nr:aminodeoxychorismate lyase [Antiquaquibacter oligotrophicus]MDH6179846.1 4-amino-4-deoxychorismate lyase [Antiquaquibacter oligotrophicus]UDF14393.1 aminodeoxychorismate lyase [Antiquaquibacter oligotrophicus]